MKIILFTLISIVFQIIALAQTPEQKAQIEKAMRMRDSILSSPQYQKALQQTKEILKNIPEEIMAKSLEENQQRNTQKQENLKKQQQQNIVNAKKNEDDFYWRNTIASNTSGQFSNWSFGQASLRVGFYDRKAKAYIYMPFGSISANGTVKISLPQLNIDALPSKPITIDFSEGEGIFYYKNLQFTNPNAKWVSTRFTLEVHQGDTILGYMKIGNAIKPVINLNSPCCTHKAGDGYAISWVYLTEQTAVTGTQPSKAGGNVLHDLNFKKGWNLLKIKVDGVTSINGDNQKLWINKNHSVMSNLPEDAKYFFTKY